MNFTFKIFQILLLAVVFLSGCKGKSAPAEVICGGSMNFACPADMYCEMKEGCGGIDLNGACKFRPTQCKADAQPVCGCDGVTYSNACLAAAKGVSQKSAGECVPPPPKVESAEDEEISSDETMPDEDGPDEDGPDEAGPDEAGNVGMGEK